MRRANSCLLCVCVGITLFCSNSLNSSSWCFSCCEHNHVTRAGCFNLKVSRSVRRRSLRGAKEVRGGPGGLQTVRICSMFQLQLALLLGKLNKVELFQFQTFLKHVRVWFQTSRVVSSCFFVENYKMLLLPLSRSFHSWWNNLTWK